MELKHILLIDDDDNIRRIAELTLSALGHFDVSVARSGKEALELLTRYQPQLILLDVMMPGMDGPAVFTKLKENPSTAAIPVIFMTAKVQKHEVETYTRLGANAVISKPFEPAQLPILLRKVYAESETLPLSA